MAKKNASEVMLYGVVNTRFHANNGTETTWFPTREKREAFLLELRARAIKEGLSESAVKAGVIRYNRERANFTAEERETIDADGTLRVTEKE